MDKTQEELDAELAARKLPKEEDVRAKVIEDYGFDETADAERIDKLVADKMDSAKKLYDAVGQKIKQRTEKEELLKNPPKPEVKEPEYTLEDSLALQAAGVTIDDLAEVKRVSKVLGKSIAESLLDPVTKNILSTRKEERATAAATQTKGSPIARKTTGDDLIRQAEQGNLPDDSEIDKVVAAELDAKAKMGAN